MRARMTVGFVTAVAVLLGVTGAGLLVFAEATNRAHTRESLDSTALELRHELEAGRVSVWRPDQLLEGDVAGFRASHLALAIYDERGRFLLGSNADVTGTFGPQWATLTVVEKPRRLVLARSLERSHREWRTLATSLLFLGLIVLAASALGAWILVGRVLSPIDRLAEVARRAPVETARLQSPSRDAELQKLVGTLNDFLARLRENNRQKERFYAAASHELRTPLQGLAGFLEIGLSRPRSHAELIEILNEAQGQSQRLVKLTADLLALSSLENSAQPVLERAEVDVADVIERALQPLETLRREKNLRLEVDFSDSVADAEILASWSHVEMLVRNLVENAHKYAPDGATISIHCHRNVLSVANPIGWTSNEKRALAHEQKSAAHEFEPLFEPFFRLETAREGKIGGNGLGLAICRAICDASGWTIELRPTQIGAQTALEARVNFEPPVVD